MTTIAQMLGLTSPMDVYQHFWKNHGFTPVGENGETESVQSRYADPKQREAAKGLVAKRIKDIFETASPDRSKALVTSTTVAAGVPLVYDPEFLDILRADAPILSQLSIVGWAGPTYKGMNISARGHPIGFLTEAESANVTTQTPSGFTGTAVSQDMVIQADMVSVTDFSQRAAEHQFSVRDTALGVRFSEAMQLKEQAVLYGDPSQAKTDYGIGDAQAPTGYAKQFATASTATDKSSVSLSASDALLKDIKSEIKGMIKTYGVTPSDLFIGTSWEVHDELDNELNVHGRTEVGAGTVNYGAETLKIAGIPVIPSHNVKTQADWGDGFTPGYDGDVFILNKRAHIIPSLAPPFVLPMGRRGLSDEWVMGDYYAVVDRSSGKWGKYLYNYDI
jgi:hypothetical protein